MNDPWEVDIWVEGTEGRCRKTVRASDWKFIEPVTGNGELGALLDAIDEYVRAKREQYGE